MFDMRFVANPHWVDELRPLTGIDQPVRDYCAADPAGAGAMDRIEALLTDLDSPLLGRRQNLSDRGVRLHWGASPVGRGSGGNGGAVA